MSFRDIEFGRTSGEAEAAELPHLVADGYFDAGFLEPLTSQRNWLVLARKGAGKSILGEKIKQLVTSTAPSSSVALTHLADFPFKTFSHLMPATVEKASRYPASWSWLLCLQIIDLLRGNSEANKPINVNANGAIEQLEVLGLLPTADLQKLVVRSSKSGFKAQIPKLLEYFNESTAANTPLDLAFLNLLSNLKELIAGYSFNGNQFLIIDGLDDILTKEAVQYETLSALIFETSRLNAFFKSKRLPIWIVVLCRTDIYEVLPGANKNKIRQDSCVELDWYPPSGDVEQSKLLELANLRGCLSLKREIDVFRDFLPVTMEHGIPVKKYLTDLTRHTPRDFIALLTHIQRFSRGAVVSRAEIIDGAKSYSEKYFLPEIKDELVGYVSPRELEIFLNAVGEIHERAFTMEKLEQVAVPLGLQKAKLDVLMHALFAASAIGMTWRDRHTRQNKFEFKFRNPNSNFNSGRTVVLHKGLWKALNIS
ncbi:P-loop ATPase, Sll1717 family [Hydrogenophaga electricum]|uniref:Orc1-like AAA ATPase domain-containing protein n=1 Tax=Hydrogenophaga electricum TaxID=1230953 RepID=A0ABQ6C6Z1_9BURK|nr:hypothetical protein [Hydrogenophaga electricum]GLS15894.1 hypothetical protein GCM10007935_33310 [Hydrogenophaga electricum]